MTSTQTLLKGPATDIGTDRGCTGLPTFCEPQTLHDLAHLSMSALL